MLISFFPPYPPYLPTLLSSLWYMQEDTPAGKVPKVASTSSVTYVKNKPSLPKPLGSVVSQILVHIMRGKNKKSVISKKISAKPKTEICLIGVDNALDSVNLVSS